MEDIIEEILQDEIVDETDVYGELHTVQLCDAIAACEKKKSWFRTDAVHTQYQIVGVLSEQKRHGNRILNRACVQLNTVWLVIR